MGGGRQDFRSFLWFIETVNSLSGLQKNQQVYIFQMFRRIGKSVHQDVPGVIFSSGQTWMEQRRFALSTLRDFGYGKQDMEDIVAEEVSDLLAILERDYQDKPIVIGQLFNILNLNSLWRLTTSEKLDSSDPKLQRLTRILDKFFKEIASPMNQVHTQ